MADDPALALGFALAVGALQWLEHRYVLRAFSTEIHVAIVAAIVVAGLAYAAVWEIYLASTGYRFMDDYLAGMAEAMAAQDRSPAEVAAEMANYEWVRVNYPNPLIRVPLTFSEVFPVGLLAALVSAALLRNPKLLPATRRG